MNTLNVQLFDLTTLLFGGASGTYIAAMYGKKETLARIGTWICVAAAIVSTAALGVRWIESYKMGIGRIPVTNLYESLVFFAWSVNLFYLAVEWKYKSRAFGAFVIPIAFLTMVFAFTNESGIQPLVPALQSYWLHAHVITCFVGYAAFAVSAGVAVMYLLKARQEKAGTTEGVIARFPSSKSSTTSSTGRSSGASRSSPRGSSPGRRGRTTPGGRTGRGTRRRRGRSSSGSSTRRSSTPGSPAGGTGRGRPSCRSWGSSRPSCATWASTWSCRGFTATGVECPVPG